MKNKFPQKIHLNIILEKINEEGRHEWAKNKKVAKFIKNTPVYKIDQSSISFTEKDFKKTICEVKVTPPWYCCNCGNFGVTNAFLTKIEPFTFPSYYSGFANGLEDIAILLHKRQPEVLIEKFVDRLKEKKDE